MNFALLRPRSLPVTVLTMAFWGWVVNPPPPPVPTASARMVITMDTVRRKEDTLLLLLLLHFGQFFWCSALLPFLPRDACGRDALMRRTRTKWLVYTAKPTKKRVST